MSDVMKVTANGTHFIWLMERDCGFAGWVVINPVLLESVKQVLPDDMVEFQVVEGRHLVRLTDAGREYADAVRLVDLRRED